MKRQVAVIGLGRFGYGVAETLIRKGCEVLAVAGYSVEEVAVPDHRSGLRLGEAQIRENYQINVIGIKKKVTRMVKGRMVSDEVFNVTPSLDDVIEKGDVLVVIGRQEDLDRLTKLE